MKRNNQSKKISDKVVNFNRKIVEFFGYIRNFKNSRDEEKVRELTISRLNSDKEKLNKIIEELTNDKIGYDELLKNKDKKIENLKEDFATRIKELNSKIDNLSIQLETKDKLLIKENKKVIDLEKKLKEKELSRRITAGKLGGAKGTIKNLEKQIQNNKIEFNKKIFEKDTAIDFYKNRIKEPTLKELKEYKYGRKNSSDKYK